MDLSKVKELYDKNIDAFGVDPKSVGWGTQEKIDIRFKQLFHVISDKTISFSLNEIGCGYGAAVQYCKHNQLILSEYIGYDISHKMLVAATDYLKEFKNKQLILDSKLREKKDYAITSGIFNVMFDKVKSEWEKYILSVLNNLNEFSQKGFSFNMLSTYVDYTSENLYYGDPSFYFDYCKKHFSKNVALLHDYNLYEFTIVVKK